MRYERASSEGAIHQRESRVSATAHVLLNGRTIATITGTSTASTTLYYVYSDNLGSADVTADSNNRVQEVTDYTPFGYNHDQP